MQVKLAQVISTKMEKTAVVKVDTSIKHPLYKKTINRSKKIKARNEIGAHVGRKVKIVETKPVSKDVHFKITEVIK